MCNNNFLGDAGEDFAAKLDAERLSDIRTKI